MQNRPEPRRHGRRGSLPKLRPRRGPRGDRVPDVVRAAADPSSNPVAVAAEGLLRPLPAES